MQEYERTITTVVNSYVRPEVSKYIDNLQRELDARMNGTRLSILRSDGGLSSAAAAAETPGEPADVRAGRRRVRRHLDRQAGRLQGTC
jgi:N-methylhydantoinase A/oxoprolinase/acetone carboxylase beta subunit